MSIKSYFDQELAASVAFAVVGAAVGYLSFLINNPAASFVLMVVVGTASYFLFRLAAKIKQDRRWWVSNAFVVYVFLWLISWTIYYNVALR